MSTVIKIVISALKRLQAAQKERERGTGKPVRKDSPPTRRVEPGVRIEYSPNLDGDPDPGEVVWTWVPFEDDPQQGKDRPVVIIGRLGNQLAGVQLTSKRKDRPEYVAVGTGAWDPQGRPSFAKVDRLLEIDPVEVRREGAVLPEDRFESVVREVDRFHDVAPR